MAPTKSIQKVSAPATPTPVPAGGFQISLVLMIGAEEYVLTGNSFKDGIKVVYSQPWQQAADLGSIADALTSIGTTLGLGADLGTQALAFLGGLPAPLDKVAAAVLNSHLIITDLIIDTTGTAEGGLDVYSFGFGLKFVGQNISVGTVELEAFLVQYTYTKAHS